MIAIPRFDWISVSFDTEPLDIPDKANTPTMTLTHSPFPAALVGAIAPGGWEPTRGLPFYSRSYRARSKDTYLHVDNVSDGSCLLQVTGRNRAILGSPLMWDALAEAGRVTRLDVAWDIVPAPLEAQQLYQDLRDELRAFGVYHRVDVSATGSTLYIGHRRSRRMVRIYDKPAEETGLPEDSLRVEMQLNNRAARSWGQFIINGPRAYVPLVLEAVPMLRDTEVGEAIADSVDGDLVPLRVPADDQPSAHHSWWHKQVISGWRNWYAERPEDALKGLERLQVVADNS